MSKPLVVNDRTLVNFRQPVIGRVGKHRAVTPEFNAAIRVLPGIQILAHRAAAVIVVLKQQQHFIVADRQRFRNLARFAPGKYLVQVVVCIERTVHVKIMPRCLRETPVVVRHKFSGKGVSRVRRTDVTQPEFLDQPVLQREMRSLHAALGRAGVGADAGDVQLVHRATELRLTVAASRIPVVNAEHAGLVAVKGQRLAVLFQVAARGFKVGERGLGADEMKLHQAAGRVIHVNQQRAGRTAFLEPAVIAAVDLYQFANARAAVAWLLDFWRTMPARDPEA
ncbi:hypothetical protein SB02110_04989 [Klebsiella quasipneumoniae subsp. quasipneumoniae]|nr:hypothetical protein SB02110_04989 [Klebsiella quasipneumoniae subsp. quasipneumoniae]